MKIFIETNLVKVKYQYTRRIKEALTLVDTEYIVLAADDDFYFPEYFYKSIVFLENNRDFGSVYGHILKFKLDKFVPYGKLIEIFVSKDNNPPNPWQEDNNFLDRLSSLGKNPWSWFSWYAVQRKEILQITIEEALNFKIDGFLFEKFVSFCHSALYKAKKLDYFYCARQENHFNSGYGREPFSYKRNIKQFDNFIEGCSSFLNKHKKVHYNVSKKYY